MPDITIGTARADETELLTTMIRSSAAYTGEQRVMVVNQTVDQAYLDDNIVRVARGDDGGALGFYSVLVPGRGAPGEAELDFMFVDNAAQGRGIGRALFDDMVAGTRALGITRVHIVSHPPAEEFYRRCGATFVETIAPSGRVTWARPLLVVDLS